MDLWQQKLTRNVTKRVNHSITEHARQQASRSTGEQRVYYAPFYKWLSLWILIWSCIRFPGALFL